MLSITFFYLGDPTQLGRMEWKKRRVQEIDPGPGFSDPFEVERRFASAVFT